MIKVREYILMELSIAYHNMQMTKYFFQTDTLVNTLELLDYFAKISCLEINLSKTKLVWIGSKIFSNEVYHKDRWKIDWGSTCFKM